MQLDGIAVRIKLCRNCCDRRLVLLLARRRMSCSASVIKVHWHWPASIGTELRPDGRMRSSRMRPPPFARRATQYYCSLVGCQPPRPSTRPSTTPLYPPLDPPDPLTVAQPACPSSYPSATHRQPTVYRRLPRSLQPTGMTLSYVRVMRIADILHYTVYTTLANSCKYTQYLPEWIRAYVLYILDIYVGTRIALLCPVFGNVLTVLIITAIIIVGPHRRTVLPSWRISIARQTTSSRPVQSIGSQ